MSKVKTHGMGANPPPSMEWQIGQTAASIWFVKQAERFLPQALPLVHERLTKAIADIKEHRVVLKKELTVETFLKKGFPVTRE